MIKHLNFHDGEKHLQIDHNGNTVRFHAYRGLDVDISVELNAYEVAALQNLLEDWMNK